MAIEKPDLKYFYWYPKKFLGDKFVQCLSFTEKGAYFLLLQHQMVHETIPRDLQRLANLVQCEPAFLEKFWNERHLDLKFIKRTQRWINTGPEVEDGYWQDLSPEELEKTHRYGEELQNEMMEKVRALNTRIYESRRLNGQNASSAKFSKKVQETVDKVNQLSSTEEPLPDFNWGPVLNDYPKKKKRTGWEEGIQILVNTITTEEEYYRFWAAVKAYKKEMRGRQEMYIKALTRFMGEWTNWVPDDFRYKPKQAAPKPEIEVDTQPAAPSGRRVLLPGEKPPWEPHSLTTPAQRLDDEKFWTPERKERWWNQLPLDGAAETVERVEEKGAN